MTKTVTDVESQTPETPKDGSNTLRYVLFAMIAAGVITGVAILIYALMPSSPAQKAADAWANAKNEAGEAYKINADQVILAEKWDAEVQDKDFAIVSIDAQPKIGHVTITTPEGEEKTQMITPVWPATGAAEAYTATAYRFNESMVKSLAKDTKVTFNKSKTAELECTIESEPVDGAFGTILVKCQEQQTDSDGKSTTEEKLYAADSTLLAPKAGKVNRTIPTPPAPTPTPARTSTSTTTGVVKPKPTSTGAAPTGTTTTVPGAAKKEARTWTEYKDFLLKEPVACAKEAGSAACEKACGVGSWCWENKMTTAAILLAAEAFGATNWDGWMLDNKFTGSGNMKGTFGYDNLFGPEGGLNEIVGLPYFYQELAKGADGKDATFFNKLLAPQDGMGKDALLSNPWNFAKATATNAQTHVSNIGIPEKIPFTSTKIPLVGGYNLGNTVGAGALTAAAKAQSLFTTKPACTLDQTKAGDKTCTPPPAFCAAKCSKTCGADATDCTPCAKDCADPTKFVREQANKARGGYITNRTPALEKTDFTKYGLDNLWTAREARINKAVEDATKTEQAAFDEATGKHVKAETANKEALQAVTVANLSPDLTCVAEGKTAEGEDEACAANWETLKEAAQRNVDEAVEAAVAPATALETAAKELEEKTGLLTAAQNKARAEAEKAD